MARGDEKHFPRTCHDKEVGKPSESTGGSEER
jgi:hypothetical protein